MLEIRSTGTVAHEVVDEVLAMLDIEESMLDYSAEERERVRVHRRRPAPSRATASTCGRSARPSSPDTPGECDDCLREGTAWVHLRMCSAAATSPAATPRPGSTPPRTTRQRHPVMRSAEPGEDWRWCFVDEVTG